ncbi:Coatomer subunit epsilon [Hondaea fermentalgiana]|uniref:Coatomer subunit epsilon n=1 Tax=Hondaea fermentalgiana TaxID=2315210 RepID=A0A2R5GKW8_9STRA|nr:Coatomer subunit epsilon [Hondaea fermentalgiana]|eukprot:GBG30378.1 Coatomer subunit epsilon [Hondaea fermentalgiana]
MELDELFSVRNLFWLGSYDAAIEEAQQLQAKTDREKIDRDVYVFRSYIAKGEGAKVIDAVGDQGSASTDVLAVKLLASFVTQPNNREAVLGTFTEWLNDETSKDNQMLQIMASTAFAEASDTKEALRALRATGNLEVHALRVQIFIGMNRVDLATKELKTMQDLDDDSALTQLSLARVHLASGGEKYQEAAYIFQEQIDKTMSSTLLLNGLAASHMQMKNFSDAEKYLQEARQKDPKDVDVLINSISCAANLRKPLQPLIGALKEVAPGHPLLEQLGSCKSEFDRMAASFEVPAS